MKLLPDWGRIVKRAWSFKFMLLAGFFTTLEIVLPLYDDAIPRGYFVILTLVAVTGGLIARVIAQKGLNDT